MGVCQSHNGEHCGDAVSDYVEDRQLGKGYHDAKKQGDSELIALAADQKFMMVEALLLSKADPNERSRKNGMTAIHYAAKYNNRQSVQGLITFKADPEIHNSDGESAMDVAHRCNAGEVARFLQRYKQACMQDFNVDFTKKTKRTLQAIEREKSCSSNNQRHFWVTVDSRESSKVHHLEGVIGRLSVQGRLTQCVVFVNHRKHIAPVVAMFNKMSILSGFQITSLDSNHKSRESEEIQKMLTRYHQNKSQRHILVTVDHPSLDTDHIPIVINFDIPLNEPRTRYQERAAGASIVVTLVNILESTDKSSQRMINDLYNNREHGKIVEFY